MIKFEKPYTGIGQSKNDLNTWDNLVNADVHTFLDEVQANPALVSESTVPNEPCVRAKAPNGDVYYFSTTSGKTWKRAIADATYTLVNTNANGAHLNARYFGGYVYYATSTKLGRFNLVSTWSDSFGTFTNGAAYKPMYEKNLSLFIGDGKYVAAVDNAGTFSANVLDIPAEHTVSALTGSAYDLLIGTIIGANTNECGAFLWDTYSPSWTSDDMIPGNGVNCFIDGDGIIFAQIGTNGWIYYWTGGKMKRFFRLRNVTTAYNDQCSTVHNSRPLFATGTKIFSIHRESESFPYAVVQEYTTTTGTIKSLISVGDQLLVSTGTNIDKIGTNYATVTIDTPEAEGSYNHVIVRYHEIGSGGTIEISTNPNNTGYTPRYSGVDDKHMNVNLEGGIGDCDFLQARIVLTPSGSNNIRIKSVTFK